MALVLPPNLSTPVLAHAPAKSRAPARPVEPLLSVVIVNYCQWRATAQLVRALKASPCVRHALVEIVVVDNHSPAHPLIRRLRRSRGVSLRRWGRNRGFARAVNEGVRLSRGRMLLLLNPDVTPGPGFLDGALARAARLAEQERRVGIVGFRLLHEDGTPQASSGPFPTLGGTLLGLALPRAVRKCRPVKGRRTVRAPWVTGCCWLLDRRCWQEVGGLDPSFFLYYEDVDFCRRVHARGWSVLYDPGLTVVHHRPLHSRPVSAQVRLYIRQSLLTYSARHWPAWQGSFLAGVVRLEACLRGLWAAWRGRPRDAALYAELARIAADMGRGRFTAARRRLMRSVRREGSGVKEDMTR